MKGITQLHDIGLTGTVLSKTMTTVIRGLRILLILTLLFVFGCMSSHRPLVHEHSIHRAGAVEIVEEGYSIAGDTTVFKVDHERMMAFDSCQCSPMIVSRGPAHYPEICVAAGVEGTVRLKVTLDADGMLLSESLISSDGEVFRDDAHDAIAHLSFRPCRRNCIPVECSMIIAVRYRLTLLSVHDR